MTTNATSGQEPDASNSDRTLDSWDDLIYGDTVRYVGENHTNLGLDGVLTFLHISMYKTTVTFEDRFHGRRPLAVEDWPAEDFERVTDSLETVVRKLRERHNSAKVVIYDDTRYDEHVGYYDKSGSRVACGALRYVQEHGFEVIYAGANYLQEADETTGWVEVEKR